MEQDYQSQSISADKLFLDNIYIVDGIIKKLYNKNYLKDDLRQVGLSGLFKASSRYSEARGVKFSTYATYFILGEIRKELRNNKLIKTGKKVNKVISLLKDGKTLKEIKETTDYQDEDIYNGLVYLENVMSLGDTINDYGEVFNHSLEDISIVLKGKLYDVIKYKYYYNYTQKAISEILNISQSKVSRLESTSLAILKKHLS